MKKAANCLAALGVVFANSAPDQTAVFFKRPCELPKN